MPYDYKLTRSELLSLFHQASILQRRASISCTSLLEHKIINMFPFSPSRFETHFQLRPSPFARSIDRSAIGHRHGSVVRHVLHRPDLSPVVRSTELVLSNDNIIRCFRDTSRLPKKCCDGSSGLCGRSSRAIAQRGKRWREGRNRRS